MSYEVTATRRRPQKLGDLVGQEFVAETLRNSILSGKIAHAYLFSGPRGCGKTSTARILAKALNCQNGPTPDPCCQCSACQEITKGSSLDVIEIDGASNTSVENIRQIKDEVLFPPSNCRYKIYIIDEVHMLSTSAFNALLKTIEEPPPYVIFIFATTELQKVPATIKSRCQQFNFRLVAIDKVKECLAQAAAELNIQADDEALFWIARESTGSMRDAYTLFDQVVAFSDGHITYEKIRDKLGLVGIERLNSLFEACAKNQADAVINLLDEFLQGGISIEQLISNCADYLRSLLLIKSGVTKESLLGNSPERYSREVLTAWNNIQIERALSIFLQLYRDIRYSLSPRYELELAFSRLCWIGQYVSNMEVKKAIDAAQALLAGAPLASSPVNVQSSQTNQQKMMSFAQPQVPSQAAAAPQTQVQPAQTQTQAAAQNFQNAQGSQPVNGSGSSIPHGLPRLSMLDNAPEEDYPEDDTGGGGAPEGEQNPFSNGGFSSLPPEQTMDKADEQPKELDVRLKINVSSQTIQIQPDQLISAAESEGNFGYSFNPDDPNDAQLDAEAELGDDNWSNVDEPPPEAYYGEEFDEGPGAGFAPQNPFGPQTVAASGTGAAGNNQIVTASGPVALSNFRENVIQSLSTRDGFAASTLQKTSDWRLGNSQGSGDRSVIIIQADLYSEYDISIFKQKEAVINAELSSAAGSSVVLQVELKKMETAAAQVKKEIPPQVKLLVDIFKGTLIGR